MSRCLWKFGIIIATVTVLEPLALAAPTSRIPMFQDRTPKRDSVPVARNVREADYVDVYSVSLRGVTAGQLVHFAGQASFSNKLGYNVGLGIVLLRMNPDGSTTQIIPYSMENVTPELHHTIRPFSVYDVPPFDNPAYVLRAYAVATKVVRGDSLPIHRNGYLQAVAISPVGSSLMEE